MEEPSAGDAPSAVAPRAPDDLAAARRRALEDPDHLAWPWGDSPVWAGRKVPVDVADGLLAACGCPQLPETGPLSPEHVEAAWANTSLDFAIEFDNGMELGFQHGAEPAEVWLSDMPEYLAETGDPATLIPLRDTYALANEAGVRYPGSWAGLTWIEGTYMIDMAGQGGQPLAEVIAFAESLPHCDGCQG